MLTQANISVIDTLRLFKSAQVPVCFLAPTKTGIEKSIMDATKSVRDFLQERDIHNFSTQMQGTISKVLVPTLLVSGGEFVDTKTSLYRPETKSGDPRIWVYKLGEYVEPGDLLAITVNKEKLVVVNCSKSNLHQLVNRSHANFSDLFLDTIVGLSSDASELLTMMRSIGNQGYVTTLRPGDTGVGYTLETLLGIAANSSKAPDFRGIEIKSGRSRSQRSGRTTVFSQVPNWNMSRLKGSKDILYTRGRYHEIKQRMQLFHEFSVSKTNSYNMKLDIDFSQSLLHQVYVENGSAIIDVSWELDVLKKRLSEKHKETFWVSAETRGKSGNEDEEFFYSSVKHTGAADVSMFPTLLETGVVTLDYTIKEVKPGTAKDQGYLFKIASKNLDLLFSRVETYSLT
jgi:hypothetical protein